jgi:hypothetical protein
MEAACKNPEPHSIKGNVCRLPTYARREERSCSSTAKKAASASGKSDPTRCSCSESAAREKANKTLEKTAEKERRDGLTNAERRAEDAQKKLLNAERIAAKTLEAEERLRAAQEIAAGIAAPLANAAANDEVNA